MKKALTNKLLYCFFFLAFGAYQVDASQYLGNTITYSNISPNAYIVNLQQYISCGITPLAQVDLNLKAPGCNSGRLVIMNLTGQQTIGNPYCASMPLNCTLPDQYKIINYTATVIFSASEQNCSDWVFSWSSCCRPASGSVIGQPDAYTEARLKLNVNIANNSARLNVLDEPIPVFCRNEPVQYSLNAYDPDCDSLSYELVAPLTANNSPVSYKPLSISTGPYLINPYPNPPFDATNNPQIALTSQLGTGFRPDFPLVSTDPNWGIQQFIIAQPYFLISEKYGVLNFVPRDVVPDTLGGTKNLYLVGVIIKEWRKVNGVPTQVGSTRRDIAFKIEDCGQNRVPIINPISIVPSTGYVVCFPIASGIFNVFEGEQLQLQFYAGDLNASDVLSVETDLYTQFPGAQLTITPNGGSNSIKGVISWNASAYTNCDKIRFFRIRVSDNACPIRGKQDIICGVRVIKFNSPLALKETVPNPARFTVFPNPFTREVTFKIGASAESIIIYNILGQQVDEILLSKTMAAEHNFTWKNASACKPGTYIARLISADKTIQTLKFTKLQ